MFCFVCFCSSFSLEGRGHTLRGCGFELTFALGALQELAKKLPSNTVTKTCEDSRVELVLPFSSDELLRQQVKAYVRTIYALPPPTHALRSRKRASSWLPPCVRLKCVSSFVDQSNFSWPISPSSSASQYVSPFGHVRVGRILEDLDAFAGNVAFLHCDDGDPTTRLPNIVTASVDKLDLIPKVLDANADLKIVGGVTSVGSSSMEVRIDAFQGPGWPCVLTTFFTMVALEPTTGKPHKVNRLNPVTELDKQRAAEGERAKVERLKVKEAALHVRVPSPDELQLVHQFFIDKDKDGNKAIEIASTHQRSLIFCSQQQRNIHNKIFGGFLMKQAFELAFSTAYLFAGVRPYFSALGDITFKYPVEIGSLLDLRAAVVYTEGNDIQVHVTARVHNPTERTCKKTNDFAFSFDLYNEKTMQEIAAPAVRPNTYAEAMSFLEGRRSLHRHRLD